MMKKELPCVGFSAILHAMDANLKPIIARHFDYSTREKGGLYYCGEWFSPKHESSLEDLISDLEGELTDSDQIKELENE